MAIPLYGVFSQYSDDEEKKTPSQKASEQVKQARYYGVSEKPGNEFQQQKATFKPEEPPSPEPQPEAKKTNFFQRAVEAVSGALRKITSKPVVSPVPEEKPQSSLFDQAYQAVQKPLTRVDSIFENMPSWIKKSPAEVAVESIQGWLAKPENEKVTFALSKVQELTEADFKRKPESLGFVKGAAGTYMGHMKSFEDYFNTEVNVPKDKFGKARYKAGELIGQVVGYMGGGMIMKALGLGRATLPVLFAVTGQTSTPSSLTVRQRIAKAPVDVLTGYLFGKVPLSEKIISKKTLKGVLGVTLITYPTNFISYLIEGLPKEEAAKVAAQAAFVQAIFHGVMTGINQLTRTPTLQKEVVMTPDEIRTQVEGTRIGETPAGKQLLEVAQKAEVMGKSVKINVAAIKQSPLAKAIGKEIVEKVTGKPQEIKFTDGTGAQAVMQVEFVEKPKIELLKEEGITRPSKTHPPVVKQEVTKPTETTRIQMPKEFSSPLEEKSFSYLEENLDTLKQRYKEKFGNVVNPDSAKELFKPIGYDYSNAKDVHEASSQLAKLIYEDLLETNRNVGNGKILFTTGGSGVGKTTAVKDVIGENADDYSIIYDSNLSNLNAAEEKIDQALEAGYKPTVFYVYRDPVKAWNEGVLKRTSRGERHVPLSVHLQLHDNSRKVVLDLYDKYKESVNFVITDNSGQKGEAKVVGVDFLRQVAYNETDVKKQIYAITDQAIKEGRITKEKLPEIFGGKETRQRTEQGRPQVKVTPQQPAQKVSDTSGTTIPASDLKIGDRIRVLEPSGKSKAVGKEVLTVPENLPFNEKSEVILKKLTSPAKGVDFRELEYKPNLIYGGIKREMFTDGFILIKDKAVAKQFNQELIDKKEKEYIKSLQKSSRELTYEQAEKFAKEETQSQIENADKNYPTDEAIQKLLDIKYSDKEAKIVGFNNIGDVYLYDGKIGVMVDGNKIVFMQKQLPDSSIRLSSRESAVVFVKGKEITGLLMPKKFEGEFPFEAGKPKKISQKAPASIDRYADLPNITQQEVFKTIPFPEMVRLAKDLTNSYPEIGKPRFRKSLVFKDINQAAKTLAHEIGHLIDYLPDQVITRGDILGRIGTLRKFLRQKFTSPAVEKRIDELISKRTPLQEERRSLRDENGMVTDKKWDAELLRQIKPLNKEIRFLQEKAIKNKEVREELINLSKLWKPYGERTVTVDGVEMQVMEELSDEYISYRESPEELYADALSVLINDPALLRKEAPVFHKAFFEFLDRKPIVKDAYFELMDFLNEPDDVVQTRRLENLYKGFEKAREKRLEIEKKEKPKKSWLEKVMFRHVTRFDPIYRKLDKISKGYGIELSPKTKLRMQLEEMQMRRNDSYLYLYKVNNDVVVPLEKIGLSEDDLGVMLTLERNLGDRKDIANPYGLQGKYSQEALDFLKNYLQKNRGITDEQFTVLEQVARKFREYQFKEVEDATNAQLYSKEFFEKTAKPNKDTYVTYQVIDHIHDNYVSAGVKKAIGTLKEIENPFVSSIFKTIAIINQTEIQKGKLAVIKQLKENFADDISPSEPMKARAGVRIGWKPKENRSPLELFEDGKRVAYDIDPYISEMFDFYSPTELHSLVQVSSTFNRFFKPLVTTYNLSWGFYSNISRDTRRTYKNLATILPKVGKGKGLSIFEFVYRWLTAIPSGVQFQRGKLNSILEEMIENKAYTTSFVSFDGQANEEASIALVMRKFRFLQPLSNVKDESLKRKMLKPLVKILKGIEFAASTFETTSKVAGYQIIRRRVQDAKFAGFLTRNYIGTPNFIDGGTQKQIDNNVFVFSNVMLQGVRTDLELATNPQTRSGYWFRTFLIDILPKIMMLAAGAGLLGLKLKNEIDKATEYDKTNYIIVPLGTRENGKANYWRIPQDETGRFIGALIWKVGSFINGSLKKPEQLFVLGAGYIPSVTPMWEVAGAWINYAQGKNPYDSYRGRLVVDDLTWKAGGLPVFERMIQYTSNQLGFSQFSTYSDETDTTFDILIKTTPIINRAFRSTDYGLTEKEQAIKKEIDQKNARRILKERELLDNSIKWARENPENKRKIEETLIREAIGEPPYDEVQRRRKINLEKKFQIGLIKGKLSQEMDALIEADTNEYKVELLKIYKRSLGIIGYQKLIRDGREYKIISDELIKKLIKEKLY